MTLLAATDNAPTPTSTDTRRITEDDADYQRLHARYARRLRGSIATLVRGLRSGDQSAVTAFLHRHIDLMREAYVAAHEEGQRDYWHTVSLKRPPIVAPDQHLIEQRLAWYALGSVLKMAREATAAAQQHRGAMQHSDGSDGATATTARSRGIYTLAGDPDPLAQWQASTGNRADLQAAIGWSGIQDGYLAGGRNDGANPFALVWWELDPPAQHCAECPMMAAGSPYNAPGSGGNELDRTPGDGRTECGAGCKCSLVYKPAAEREAIATATAWQSYYNTLQATAGGGAAVEPSRIEQYKAYGRGEPIVGSFNQEMAQRLPNEPLIVPPQVPIEAAQKQALDNVRAARDAWAKVRADYPDLPEFPWYFSENGGEHAVPLLYGQFYDYAEVAAALERLWDANAVWLSLNVAGDNADTEMAETDGGAVLLYSPEQARDRRGRFAPEGGSAHESGGRGHGGAVHEALTHSRGASGGGGGGGGSGHTERVAEAERRVAQAHEEVSRATERAARASMARDEAATERFRAQREHDATLQRLHAMHQARIVEEQRATHPEAYARYHATATAARTMEAAHERGSTEYAANQRAMLRAENELTRHGQLVDEAVRAEPEYQASADRLSNALALHQQARSEHGYAAQAIDDARGRVESAQAALEAARGGGGVRFNYLDTMDGPTAEESLREVFGRDVSETDLAALSGARPGDRVEILAHEGWTSFRVSGQVKRDFYVRRNYDDTVTLHDNLTVNQGARTTDSGETIVRGMHAAQRLGVTRIETTAARGDNMNGYRTWVKLGFDGDIPPSVSGAARADWGDGVTRVSDIVTQQGGMAWWRTHGDSFHAAFDFRDGSYSRRVFDRLMQRMGSQTTPEGEE